MPRATPKWKAKISEFIGEVVGAVDEDAIRKACDQIKALVVECYPNTPKSRRNPMAEIKQAIRGRYPAKPVKKATKAKFPYYYTATGKRWERGSDIANHRLEHLAIKYLEEEWNLKRDLENVEESQKPVEEKATITSASAENVSLESFGLLAQELAAVNQAIGNADAREWVKQAIIQRANAINKLRECLDEDWEAIPSETLMNEKKYRTNSAACRELVSRAVRVIKQWNYDHPEHKWCITNKLIGELAGVTVKAIAKAVEGMDNESYNKGQDLEPVINRMTRAAVGEPKEVMSIARVTGAEGTEKDYA